MLGDFPAQDFKVDFTPSGRIDQGVFPPHRRIKDGRPYPDGGMVGTAHRLVQLDPELRPVLEQLELGICERISWLGFVV